MVFRSDATVFVEKSSRRAVRVRVHRATWNPVINEGANNDEGSILAAGGWPRGMAAAFLNGMNALENAPKPNSLSLGPKADAAFPNFSDFFNFYEGIFF